MLLMDYRISNDEGKKVQGEFLGSKVWHRKMNSTIFQLMIPLDEIVRLNSDKIRNIATNSVVQVLSSLYR
jgi:hypothetical protein